MLEITAAIGAARSMLDLARLGLDARDDAKVRSALTDLGLKLHDVTMSALASAEKAASLQERVSVLQGELRDAKLKAEERERYTLTEVRTGAYAYVRNDMGRLGNDPPYYCQACYDKDVKSVLRLGREFSYSPQQWMCGENVLHSFYLDAPT